MVDEPDEATDYMLLQHAVSDPDAFKVFYRRYERLVAGWLVRRTRDPELAADLTAEVFAAAYLAGSRFRDRPEPAAAWLLGIARNKLARSRRTARAEASSRRRLGLERVVWSDEQLAAVDELRDLGAVELLATLQDDQRAAVRLRVIDELEYDQIAQLAAVSEAVVRKRVSRGLQTLRSAIQRRQES